MQRYALLHTDIKIHSFLAYFYVSIAPLKMQRNFRIVLLKIHYYY